MNEQDAHRKRQTSDVGTREEEAVKLQSRHEQELMSSKAAVRCAVRLAVSE